MVNRYPDLSRAAWRKSTRSSSSGQNCVEVATNLAGVVAVRDSKDSDGAVLMFAPDNWRGFTRRIRDGEFGVG
jgi:hypothetical protein